MQHADVDVVDGLQHAGQVLGEYRCREPELAVVGQIERFVGVAARLTARTGPNSSSVQMSAGPAAQFHDGGGDEAAVGQSAVAVGPAAGQHGRALRGRGVDAGADRPVR